MSYHLFEGFIGVAGMGDLHYLNLIELMQSVQSSHVGTPRSGFAPEAWSVGNVFNRQVISIQDHVPVDICDGNFSGRDQIEVICPDVIHLSFLIGKLTCSET